MRLVDWPRVEVRIDCSQCQRRGCYRLARLAAQHGAGYELAHFLIELGRSCPFWNERPRNYEPRCGIRFTDWDGGTPRLDRPTSNRKPTAPPIVSTSHTVADLVGPTVTIVCARCKRRGVYRISTLIERFGADFSLPTVLTRLAGSCPGMFEMTPRCGAVYEGLVTRPR